jgi:hypothetical protein
VHRADEGKRYALQKIVVTRKALFEGIYSGANSLLDFPKSKEGQ